MYCYQQVGACVFKKFYLYSLFWDQMEMVTSSQPSLSNSHKGLVSEHKSVSVSSEIWCAVSEQPLGAVQMFLNSSGNGFFQLNLIVTCELHT